MPIVDQFGRPIEREVLSEPQTARTAWLHQTYATHPSRGITPAKLARILEQAEHGDLIAQFDLFEDMEEKDGHILAEMSKRKRALLSIPWDIVPPRNASAAEKKVAAELKESILDIPNFEDVLLDMADGIGKGFAALEIEWGRVGNLWWPEKICHRPQQWFQLDQETRTEIRLRDNSGAGAPLQPFGWILHTHKARSGYIARAGLHRVLAWPYLFKNYAIRDCAEFCEIYGLPVRVGRYPSGASDKEKSALLAAVIGMGHSAAGIVPDTMTLEFLEAAKGTHEPYAFIIDWCERTQSKAIVGQTTSSEAKATGLGSGIADLHGDVRDDITAADAAQLQGTLTRDLVYPLAALNFGQGDPRRAPRFVFDTQQPEDLAVLADALPKLVGVGVKIPARWVNERAKLPLPNEGEDVLATAAAPPATPPAPSDQDAPARARDRRMGCPVHGVAALRASPPEPDRIDELVDAALQEWEPAMEGLVEVIRRELVQAAEADEDLPAITARLARALPSMSTAALTELLARTAFTGRLAGEADVDLER